MPEALPPPSISPLSSGSRLRADLIRLRGGEDRALTPRESADLGGFSKSLQTALRANRDTARETPTARQPAREPPPRVQEAARALLTSVEENRQVANEVTTPRGAVLDIIV